MIRFLALIVLPLLTACAGAATGGADGGGADDGASAGTGTAAGTATVGTTRAPSTTGPSTTGPSTVVPSLQTRIVTQGGYAAGTFDRPQAMAARDEETLRRLWPEVGSGTPPSVDFTRETVVFLFAGVRPTGGWTIGDPAARIENGILVVDAPVRGPVGGATQAITQPYMVLVVNTRTFDDLRWNSR